MNQQYQVNKPKDFQVVIGDILESHKKSGQENLVITLKGDLGAGKTTFTQELGKNLGINEPITSPTFTIMKQYPVTSEHFDLLVHIDAYRIESEDETRPLRLAEIFQRPQTIVCIEWPELISSIVPESVVSVEITIGEGENRNVKVFRKTVE